MGNLLDFPQNVTMTKIVESIYAINDIATGTGNGDIMPASNLGIFLTIPLF